MAEPLDKRTLIMPTAPNVLNLVHENIVSNLRRRQASDLELPSLYRLAYMVHYNTGELVVDRGQSEDT